MLCHVSSNSSNSKKLFGRASETVQIGGWLLLPFFAGCAHRTFTFGRRTNELLKMFPRDLLSPKMKNKTPFLIIYKGRSSLALTSWSTPHLQTRNRSLQIVQTVRKIGDDRNSFQKKNVDSKNQPKATKCLLFPSKKQARATEHSVSLSRAHRGGLPQGWLFCFEVTRNLSDFTKKTRGKMTAS